MTDYNISCNQITSIDFIIKDAEDTMLTVQKDFAIV